MSEVSNVAWPSEAIDGVAQQNVKSKLEGLILVN